MTHPSLCQELWNTFFFSIHTQLSWVKKQTLHLKQLKQFVHYCKVLGTFLTSFLCDVWIVPCSAIMAALTPLTSRFFPYVLISNKLWNGNKSKVPNINYTSGVWRLHGDSKRCKTAEFSSKVISTANFCSLRPPLTTKTLFVWWTYRIIPYSLRYIYQGQLHWYHK